MVMQTTDLSWLTTTIAHEWTHNYLEQRPLGLLYDKTPELRTMNETTADISGGEIGAEVKRVVESEEYRTASVNMAAVLPDRAEPARYHW